MCPLGLCLPADNGSTLSSDGITDSATSTDNNYGYMGEHKKRQKNVFCLFVKYHVNKHVYLRYNMQ